MPSHSHGHSLTIEAAGNHDHGLQFGGAPVAGMGGETIFEMATSIVSMGLFTNAAGEHTHNISGGISNTGGNQPHENRPPYYTLAYIMKLPIVQNLQQIAEAPQPQDVISQQETESPEDKATNPDTKYPTPNTEIPQTPLEHPVLQQNIPNPFNIATTIEALVPEHIQHARITVYNLNGLELESYDINTRGKVSVKIAAGRFPSGMYVYALLADNRLIDTKKMILTR